MYVSMYARMYIRIFATCHGYAGSYRKSLNPKPQGLNPKPCTRCCNVSWLRWQLTAKRVAAAVDYCERWNSYYRVQMLLKSLLCSGFAK